MGLLEDKIKNLPENPGVYVMLDKDGQIIYVGKAKNLKNRVRQYFFNSVKTEKVMAMVKNITDFYYIIVPTEIDALSLENNLIKKHKPHYNILLKDDKTYPYVKVNLHEYLPCFTITRKIKKDGAKYFGPFMAGISVNSVLEMLNLAFLIRPCDKKLIEGKCIKPCLNYHIKKCQAPCANYISQEEYMKGVNKAVDFLSGNTTEVEKILHEKMIEASEKEEFELALKYKENIASLEKVKLKRLTSLNKFIDADIIATTDNGIYSAISMLFVRNGRMLGAKNFAVTSASFELEEQISEFITRYYKENSDIPQEIITQVELKDANILEQYIKDNYNIKTSIISAKQGIRHQLIDMCEANANDYLNTQIDRIKHKDDMTKVACQKLKDVLRLSKYPKRMECYDISNISGVDKVGSMVVFVDGEKDADSYRRFKIKTFEGADDFKAHQEMMRRRLDRLVTDVEKFPKPDLIIIDGGKGQLSSIEEIFREKNITDIDLIALAEKNEEVYVTWQSEPIIIDKRDYTLKVLQRIRDEAHRFAITYFRSLHSKRNLSSALDNIDGLGKVKKKLLLEKFMDLNGIISATKEDLMQVKGIGEKQADLIIEYLTKEGLKN